MTDWPISSVIQYLRIKSLGLTDVARKEGKRVVVVPKWFPSSKICSYCGKKNENLKIYDKEWYCPHCFRKLDRDKNAAENIRNKAYEMIKKEV